MPGIGPKAAEALASGDDPNEKITNTFQLIGKYLLLKGPDDGDSKVSCVEHCDKFWAFLQSKGVNSYRSGIVQCIAEKVCVGVWVGVFFLCWCALHGRGLFVCFDVTYRTHRPSLVT